MPIETRTHFNTPVVESRTEYKIEDDRSLGEKAKDAVKDAANTVKDAFTPEVKNKDIAKAADKQYEHEKKEMKHAEKAEKQAEKVNHLQNKQAEQHLNKCAHAMNKHAYPGDAKVTRVTEIH